MRFDYGAQEIEHLCRMSARRHVVERAAKPKIAIEDEGRARGVFALEHAERAREFSAFVGEQDKWEGVLFRKRPMPLHGIRAHADDRTVQRLELLEAVAELLGLDRAPGRIVHRVEINDQV